MTTTATQCPHGRNAEHVYRKEHRIEPGGGDYVVGADFWHDEDERCTATEASRQYDCLDAHDDLYSCQGEVFGRRSLSGATVTERCEHHYLAYVERMQPKLDEINKRYPAQAPADFDPTYAGERWDEDY